MTQTQELQADAHWHPTGHMGLVPLKRKELEKKRESVRYQGVALRSRRKKKVHCECGFDEDEGDMVYHCLDATCCAWADNENPVVTMQVL